MRVLYISQLVANNSSLLYFVIVNVSKVNFLQKKKKQSVEYVRFTDLITPMFSVLKRKMSLMSPGAILFGTQSFRAYLLVPGVPQRLRESPPQANTAMPSATRVSTFSSVWGGGREALVLTE